MIFHVVEQGSYEWVLARLGTPTASAFDKIITPAKMQLSSQAEKYARTLLAEEILRAPMDEFLLSSSFMERGKSLESEGVDWYELNKDADTSPGGFGLRDDRKAGASADRLVGADGLLEIKSPSAEVHIGYLLDAQGIGYRCQVQGQLWVYEREWNDTLSYHPVMPKALVRQYRDEEFIKKLAAAIDVFHEMMNEMKVKLQAYGLFEEEPFPPLEVVRGGVA